MAELGTYIATVQIFTPQYILPEPGDIITWDWMDAVGRFSQKARRMATMIATVNAFSVGNAGSKIFDYTSLGCDLHLPFLRSYYYSNGDWVDLEKEGLNVGQYSVFEDVGLSYATFKNYTTTLRVFYMIAYL